MTADATPTGDPFATLVPHEFAVLTTYRRSGAAMPTTIWFAHDGGAIYITTQATAGKLKRVRNDGRVTLAASDRIGALLGEEAIAGRAREATAEERPRAAAALAGKYGEQWTRIVGDAADDPARSYIVVEPR